MVETISDEATAVIAELKGQVAALAERIAKLEGRKLEPAVQPAAPPAPAPQAAPGITEEELLAISGALAAYLGVRVHIRQVRLISSRAWALEGRVSVQASHRLHS